MSQTVRAEVRYLNPEWKERRETPSIGDRDSRRANTSRFVVSIDDARTSEVDFGLDSSGFTLGRHRSAVLDFHDAKQVESIYYDEIKTFMTKLTGAPLVVPWQHIVRTEDASDFNKAYARFVHCDYSLTDPAGEVARVLTGQGVSLDDSKSWEFCFYNTWQPIERRVQTNPLAVIDSRTLAADDVVDYNFTGYGRPILTSMPVYNPDHRFYYYPLMQTDEILVIKQLDTRAARARTCPHTSFDLDADPGALGRRSIEVRLLCVFDADQDRHPRPAEFETEEEE
jgi:hypothetical protein